MNVFKKISVAATLVGVAFLSSCDKDDDDPFVASVDVMDQTLSQNYIEVASVNVDHVAWLVAYAGDVNEPNMSSRISEPVQIEEGESTSVIVPLNSTANVNDGDRAWIVVHTDDGVFNQFEYDGVNGLDTPVEDASGGHVSDSFIMDSPSITVNATHAVVNNEVTIPEVKAGTDGWLVIHNDDGSGSIQLPEIIGKVKVNAGTTSNITVDLDPNMVYTAGQKMFPMLHVDRPPYDEYVFPGPDVAEIFGNDANNIIVTEFTVQ